MTIKAWETLNAKRYHAAVHGIRFRSGHTCRHTEIRIMSWITAKKEMKIILNRATFPVLEKSFFCWIGRCIFKETNLCTGFKFHATFYSPHRRALPSVTQYIFKPQQSSSHGLWTIYLSDGSYINYSTFDCFGAHVIRVIASHSRLQTQPCTCRWKQAIINKSWVWVW